MQSDKIYTIADLRTWTRAEPSFAVVGKPIAHSLSPKMHNAAIAEFLPRGDALQYFKFEIDPEELGEALSLFFKHNFVGLNLTIPHKVIVLPFLKKNSPQAKIIGAANTLSRAETLGGFCGDNTDGDGFRLAVENELHRELAGTPIILLGAGGAARAIAATALASKCASLTLINRSRDKAETLAGTLAAHFPEARIETKSVAEISNIPRNSLVVNATSLGLKPDDESPFPPEFLQAGMAVYDATYGAKHVPALVAAARERSVPAADGRSMLAWQGALAFQVWTSVPAEKVFPIMRKALGEREQRHAIKTAFILGAGLGTRLRPLTASCPKPLLDVGGKPIICYAMDRLIEIGVERFIVNTHHCAEVYAEKFPDKKYRNCGITFSHEPILLDTGGGLKNIEKFLRGDDENLLVYNGDILATVDLQKLVETHLRGNARATLLLRVNESGGNVETRENEVCDMRDRLGVRGNARAMFTGIYAVRRDFFAELSPGKIESVVEAFLRIISRGDKIAAVVDDSGDWQDLGTIAEYEKACTAAVKRGSK